MVKVIAISRQHGSGGRQIGKTCLRTVAYPFYDKEIVPGRPSVKAASAPEQFDGADLRGAGNGLYSIVPGVPFELPVKDTLYLAQREAICNLAAGGPCVIVGRGACEVLKGRLPLLRDIYLCGYGNKNPACGGRISGATGKCREAALCGRQKAHGILFFL